MKKIKTIAAKELKAQLAKNTAILIDVREPAENRADSIQGGRLIPLARISETEIASDGKLVVVYCKSGKRSADACAMLKLKSPELDVASLEGGIEAWKKSGFDVETSCCGVISLDRQTHLAVGCIAFFGTVLGAFVNPKFYILPGFIGVGLMFAGITGFCLMSRLLAMMPWNK